MRITGEILLLLLVFVVVVVVAVVVVVFFFALFVFLFVCLFVCLFFLHPRKVIVISSKTTRPLSILFIAKRSATARNIAALKCESRLNKLCILYLKVLRGSASLPKNKHVLCTITKFSTNYRKGIYSYESKLSKKSFRIKVGQEVLELLIEIIG